MDNNYDKYILGEISTMTILLGALMILTIILIYFAIYYLKSSRKNDAIICFSVSIITISICCITVFSFVIPYISDVNNQSYIRYEGEFYVEDGAYVSKSGSQPIIHFYDGRKSERYKVGCNIYLSDGYRKGYAVYAKHSKIIVEWYCEECVE